MFLDGGTLARLSRNLIVVMLVVLLVACVVVWFYDDVKSDTEQAVVSEIAVGSAKAVVDDVVEIGQVFSAGGRSAIDDRVDWLFGLESESGSGCGLSGFESDSRYAGYGYSGDCDLGSFGGVLVEQEGREASAGFLRGLGRE